MQEQSHSNCNKMFNLVRELVGGAKNRTLQGNYNLDLTYITDRIIAMAFPAAGFEKVYRNCIEDVAAFFNEKHPNSYLVVNLANRGYNYGHFNGKVKEFPWQDHQAPCLTTLFELCDVVNKFLEEKEQNVVAVHCNHGKGRTGTAIMALLLFERKFDNVPACLAFYNKKRFSSQDYGVSQFCQLRYLEYFNTMMKRNDIPQKPKTYKIMKVTQTGLGNDHFLQVSSVRSGRIKYQKVPIPQEGLYLNGQHIIGDIFIEIFQEKLLRMKQIARINFNINIYQVDGEKGFIAEFKGSELTVSSSHSKEFTLTIQFESYCECDVVPSYKCYCQLQRQREEQEWSNMINIIKKKKTKIAVDTIFGNYKKQ